MDDSPRSNQSNDFKTLVSVYSGHFTNRVIGFLSFLSSSIFLHKNFRLRRQSRFRKQRPRIPLPFPSYAIDSSPLNKKTSSTVHLLEDVVGQVYSNLHDIQKNLQFWLSKAEGTDSQKAYFMLFERGPRALVNETVHLVQRRGAKGSYTEHLCHSASSQISERIAILSSLQCCLATFLAQIYVEVNQPAKEQLNDPDSGLTTLLATVNTLFSKLEASIAGLHAEHQIDSPMDSRHSFPPLFERLPEVSPWTDCDVNNAIDLVYQNLNKLESYVSLMVVKHRRPRKVTQYWIRYTCGAVGLSLCSTWLLKHSSLMGSSDIEKWIREAKGSTISFFKEHVERPLLSIRDELFETFRKRHRGVMDLEEVHLTSNSLHRMLLAFTEEVNGKNIPENATDQELLEIVMSRYEKELTHPIKSLLGGELARAMLIQVQKLKLDIETAMLELNQILRANEINFAILAALPACFVSFGLLKLLGGWFKRDARAEGIGRISRIQRRLLLVEVEKKIMMYQSLLDKGLETEAQCVLGMLLYSLDCLYQAVETHAKATGEWQCLKPDILELAKPGLQTSYKLTVTSRLGRMYECLLPSLKRQ